jgi:hypothetical protein
MHDSRHSIQLIVLGVALWLAMSVKNTGGSPKHIHASSDFSPPKIFGKSNLLVEKEICARRIFASPCGHNLGVQQSRVLRPGFLALANTASQSTSSIQFSRP